MESDNNIYLGICIQNNDIEMRGRIKVYIPILAPTINALKDNTNVDKFFNFIGKENSNELSTALEDLKNILPWAEYAGPICGGNASGRYNAATNEGSTSDSNAWKDGHIANGVRPAENYTAQQAYPDAFITTNGHKNKFVNQYAYQYTPSNYSGFARGLFSIPNVGSHVYVFFLNGDRNFPIYFASSYSQEDVKRIFTLTQDINDNISIDYPASYENKKGKLDNDKMTFRSKTVLNSNKHTIELIDTDLHEILKFTHYSGSFKEFNNYATIELATNNDQKMVIGDQFRTVQKNKSEYIRGHSEMITGGDLYINVGETDQNVVKQILQIHKEIHDLKLLFDVQRTDSNAGTSESGNTNNMSAVQKCAGKTETLAGRKWKNGFVECPICKGKPYDPYDPENGLLAWREAPAYIGTLCLQTPSTGPIIFSFSPKGTTPHPFEGKTGYYRGMKCALCNGTGWSPSSEGGHFNIEPIKQSGGDLDKLILQKTPELFKLEKQLGEGDVIQTISKNKIETIGLVMNDMMSYRVDPVGKLKIDGCWVAPQGTYENFKPSPHVEYVDVADIPGGDYILTVMNKYKLLVGARGINIQTFGPLDIYGTIVNFTGEQINISSKNEVLIDGGERFALRARKIALMPFEHNAVVVEGQLHVTRNMIVQGGTMFEGEVALLHVTAPLEWQRTEICEYDPAGIPCILPTPATGVFGTIDISSQTVTSLIIPPHTHQFKNIPLTNTLLQHPEAVRETMIKKGINSRKTLAASNVQFNSSICSIELYTNNYVAQVYVNKKQFEEFHKIITNPEFSNYFAKVYNDPNWINLNNAYNMSLVNDTDTEAIKWINNVNAYADELHKVMGTVSNDEMTCVDITQPTDTIKTVKISVPSVVSIGIGRGNQHRWSITVSTTIKDNIIQKNTLTASTKQEY